MPFHDPILGGIFRPRYNIPTAFAEAVGYEQQIRCILQLLMDNYWQWATKQEVQEEVESLQEAIEDGDLTNMQAIEELRTLIEKLTTEANVYDPTQGKYVTSQTAMRNIYRQLSVYGARVSQIKQLTVAELARHRVQEVAVVGNLTIFGDDTPRVTGDDGNPYPAL